MLITTGFEKSDGFGCTFLALLLVQRKSLDHVILVPIFVVDVVIVILVQKIDLDCNLFKN